MRIKKVIMNGFKSFGESTEIEFDENLIGIVGPNGSGKSNIIDAIRWVLGQQKMSELRTKSNTDVIFSGSDERGAKNVAEVTIIFDNEDRYLDIEFGEVSIKRRLFRNGENEYYLNNNRCRLLDINNLILDKGFGKDSFSIISQGKVEEIIMSKPENRRVIIDEVAGISKYKYKKKITLNKLNKLNENLKKINFILEEIKSRIEPLEKEREKALNYKKIKKDLEESEKTLLANKIFNNKKELDNLIEESVRVSKVVIAENKKIEIIENEIKALDNLINKNQILVSQINEESNQVKNEKISLSNEIKLLAQKKELHKTSNTEDLVESVRAKISTLQSEEGELKHKKAKLVPVIESFDNQLKTLKEDIYILKTKIYNFREEKEEIDRNNERNKVPYHIKKVLEQNYDGVIGTVKSNIEVFSKYEVAINTILGYRQNELIVNNDEVAKSIINYLKSNKLGKITFSPLNTVKPKFFDKNSEEVIKNSDFKIKKAIECVKFDSTISRAIESLLGNIVIADNLDTAQKINRKLQGRYQIVTEDGDILAISGKITGGYDKNNKALFSIKKSQELDVKIKEFTNVQAHKNQELEKISFEYSEKSLQIDIINSRLNSLLDEQSSLKLEYDELMKVANSSEDSHIYKLEEKVQELDKKIFEYTEEKLKKEEAIKTALESKEEKNKNIVNMRANFKMLIQSETEAKMKIEHYEIEIKELIENLREKYNISFQKAYDDSVVVDNMSNYETEVKKLKEKIRDLGFVNLNAIEEYKVQKERLDFYLENEADLLGSKQKILDIINKIDDFVIEVFSDSFYKLNEEFKKVFEQLFEGGQATLKLTDEDDILNTGVEIIARPPGKKAQTIGLLSGGEKSFTAIALLFAILKVRIVPFTILDEVEAALDEANVVKYIEYLKVFSQKTQFILITHRQTTMEKIDKLYGVTMVEKGVSTVLDIKLKEGEYNV